MDTKDIVDKIRQISSDIELLLDDESIRGFPKALAKQVEELDDLAQKLEDEEK